MKTSDLVIGTEYVIERRSPGRSAHLYRTDAIYLGGGVYRTSSPLSSPYEFSATARQNLGTSKARGSAAALVAHFAAKYAH